MPRPSRNVDQLLLQAGRELLPETGIRQLSIRQVTERAQVNLGMFHYHFKSKDAFIRALLDEKYESMFTTLEVASHSAATTRENLRTAACLLARFARDNRQLLARLVGDALAGEAVAVEFMRANMPRHIAVMAGLIGQGQAEGAFREMPVPQALAFFAGAVAAPIMIGGAAVNSGMLPAPVAALLEAFVFSDAAIDQRIDMALAGLASAAVATPPATPKPGRKK